ncbi:MAG: starch-binding protein, partial [Pseudoflavonifractor sp.]|nr:starch-binding protein [Pseudoflavonifractor sp.]
EPNQIDVDMVATYLRLAKTTASVTSLDSETITYETDAHSVPSAVCESPLIGPDKLPPLELTVDDNAHTVKFAVNPNVDITKFTTEQEAQLKGTAECYITAGNIRKQVLVDYDITPFFTIRPISVKIQWDSNSNSPLLSKTFEYRTNLGGITLTQQGNINSAIVSPSISSGKMTTASSTIQFTGDNPLSAGAGKITVKATSNPGTTTEHYLSAGPQAAVTMSKYRDFRTDLIVTVLPPLGGYRIYFRSINDYQSYSGGSETGEFLNGDYSIFPTETYLTTYTTGNNWIDWWNPNATGGDASNGNYHRVYIYTQMGETTSVNDSGPTWRFTGKYGDGKDSWGQYDGANNGNVTNQLGQSQMAGDSNNPGWYYFDLNQNAQSEAFNGATGSKIPEPGRTLIIFYNNTYCTQGYAPHRAAHHLDPGIQLFDYEDREGYYVYDPTMEPYYRIYDDRPYIEDINYTVYSKERITGWEHKYGVAEGEPADINNPIQWRIHYTIPTNNAAQQTQVNGWYKTVIKLKAIRGDYEKAIALLGLNGTTASEYPDQYVYFYYVPGHWFDNPYAYIYYGDNDNNASWPGQKMEFFKNDGSNKIYRLKVPFHFRTAKVIFNNNSGTQTGELSLDAKNMIFYTDTSAWMEYGSQPDWGNINNNDANKVILFGGQAYPQYNHTATFENGKWRGGAPF